MNNPIRVGKDGAALGDEETECAALFDKETKLMWAVNNSKDGFPNSSKKIAKGKICNWIRDVNASGWCGYKDWRVPSYEEVKTIVRPIDDYTFYLDKKYISIFSHINKSDFSFIVKDWRCYMFCYKIMSNYNFKKGRFDDFEVKASLCYMNKSMMSDKYFSLYVFLVRSCNDEIQHGI